MNVREIVTDYLKQNRADGLTREWCNCPIDNLLACYYETQPDNCVPAKLNGDGELIPIGGDE